MDQRLIDRRNNFFKLADSFGVKLSQTSGDRSYSEQKSLYERYLRGEGAYAANPDVKPSKHMQGLAFDAIPVSVKTMYGMVEHWEGVENGWEGLTDQTVDQLGEIAESCGLKWGGRFVSTPKEPWHFELSENFSIA